MRYSIARYDEYTSPAGMPVTSAVTGPATPMGGAVTVTTMVFTRATFTHTAAFVNMSAGMTGPPTVGIQFPSAFAQTKPYMKGSIMSYTALAVQAWLNMPAASIGAEDEASMGLGP